MSYKIREPLALSWNGALVLQAMTQGRTRKEALEMAADWLETMVDRPKFKASVHPGKKGAFELAGSDVRSMIRILLRRKREAHGLSLSEVAERLGAKSRNEYARYEQGLSMPSLEKLERLLHALDPGHDILLQQSPVD